MSLSLQPPLVRSDTRRCVLATVEDARRQLRDWSVDEDDILQLIETGHLLAWNIALDTRAETKRLFRLLPESIAHFEKTGGHRPFSISDNASSCLLRGFTDFLTIREIANLLNCGPTHIAHLIEARQICSSRGNEADPGITKIARAALLAFLKSRTHGPAQSPWRQERRHGGARRLPFPRWER
jgi:hypothetical protein